MEPALIFIDTMENIDPDPHKISEFIQAILLEVAIDDRVPTGMFDAGNNLHLVILAEKLANRNIPRKVVVEVVNKLALQDGKYPHRQAYNKNGWLVTFPTPEHKTAAIKRRTHFASDPTHGRGGMNLYYKRKGKQARISQGGQTKSANDTNKTDQPSGTINPVPSQIPTQSPTDLVEPEVGGNTPTTKSTNPKSAHTSPPESPDAVTKIPDSSDVPSVVGGPSSSSPKPMAATASVQAPPIPSSTTSPTDLPESIVRVSVEFAKSKNWQDAPYGDWTDENGEQCAVTGLDGQVVPIKYVDRQELKSFAEKRMMEGIVLREAFQRFRFR